MYKKSIFFMRGEEGLRMENGRGKMEDGRWERVGEGKKTTSSY
jgi:hypothetical protein